MDHIEKLVRRLVPKLRSRVISVMGRILAGRWQGLDVKSLSGYHDVFRCRIGDLRILFARMPDGRYIIIDVGTRDQIYRNL